MRPPLRMLLMFLLWQISVAEAQLLFVPVYGGIGSSGEQLFPHSDSTSVHLDQMRGYISQVKFVKEGQVTTEKNSFHLVDFLSGTTVHFNVPEINYDSVYFTLGIDSAVQVQGVMEGDLDPSNGMYWTWQSGYIHLKLEGNIAAGSGQTRNFQFHIGGYRFPDNTCRVIGLPYRRDMKVGIELFSLLDPSVNSSDEIMSPGPAAAGFADRLQRSFYILRP